MKPFKLIRGGLAALTMICALAVAAGCESARRHDTESMLSAAGFHVLTPHTPQQRACYAALPPDKVERTELNHKMLYAYADKREGVVYVGGEANYQRFQQLAFQERIANAQLQAAEMNQSAALNWGAWGPPGVWWW